MKLFKIFTLVIITSMVLGFLTLPLPLMAQSVIRLSMPEDVALAFYKTANIMPDFEQWAKGTKEFKYKSVTQTKGYIETEKNRLLQKWNGLTKDNLIITTKSETTIMVKHTPPASDADPEYYTLHIMPEIVDEVYFPYTHQNNKGADT